MLQEEKDIFKQFYYLYAILCFFVFALKVFDEEMLNKYPFEKKHETKNRN